jgi:hypothetical protein
MRAHARRTSVMGCPCTSTKLANWSGFTDRFGTCRDLRLCSSPSEFSGYSPHHPRRGPMPASQPCAHWRRIPNPLQGMPFARQVSRIAHRSPADALIPNSGGRDPDAPHPSGSGALEEAGSGACWSQRMAAGGSRGHACAWLSVLGDAPIQRRRGNCNVPNRRGGGDGCDAEDPRLAAACRPHPWIVSSRGQPLPSRAS